VLSVVFCPFATGRPSWLVAEVQEGRPEADGATRGQGRSNGGPLGQTSCRVSAVPLLAGPCDHRIGNRLVLLCRTCDAKPEALARVRELISIEWTKSPERTGWMGSNQETSTY
jgi:hypothetical protein